MPLLLRTLLLLRTHAITTQDIHHYYSGHMPLLLRTHTVTNYDTRCPLLFRTHTVTTQVAHYYYSGHTPLLFRTYTIITLNIHCYYSGQTLSLLLRTHTVTTKDTYVLHYSGHTQSAKAKCYVLIGKAVS